MDRLRLASIAGARPNFIKLAALSPEIRKVADEIVIHTGQHYDYAMDGIFFNDMDLPKPNYNLGVGSEPHGKQAALMLMGIEKILTNDRPDAVVVYGDTNTTLAGALAAAKLHIPVVHIESGLRSHDRNMPEELNRIMVDNISDMLFCPTWTAYRTAFAIQDSHVFFEGDVIIDLLQKYARGRVAGNYYLLTIHREENDDLDILQGIFTGLSCVSENIIFPCHPRIFKQLKYLRIPDNIRVIEPVGYRKICELEAGAKKIITDSGGIQKEAYLLGVPCITLRKSTEWVETLSGKWNILTGTDANEIRRALVVNPDESYRTPWLFGQEGVCKRTVQRIVEELHG